MSRSNAWSISGIFLSVCEIPEMSQSDALSISGIFPFIDSLNSSPYFGLAKNPFVTNHPV
jgi:hypothetical protein